MADYNDGKWHKWDGGKRPVHPKSLIDHVWHDDNIKSAGITKDRLADTAAWGQTLKFRVTKPYKEPREFYVQEITCFDLNGNVTGKVYQQCLSKENSAFLVREVIE